MSINEIREKIKHLRATLEESRLFLALVIILVAFASFGLGRLSLMEEKTTGIKVEGPTDLGVEDTNKKEAPVNTISNGSVVASKNGTKYYFSWCSGVSKISQQNLITFSSKEEAESAGYTIASGCKSN